MSSIAASIQQLTVISNMYNLHQGLLPECSPMLGPFCFESMLEMNGSLLICDAFSPAPVHF